MAFNLRYVDYPASPDREFPCDFCALSFDRQHDLKRHVETHSGEKPYLCDRGCGKAFTRKDALKRHQTSFPFCPPVRGPPQGVPGMLPHPPSHMHPQSVGISQPVYTGFHPSSKYGVGPPLPAEYNAGRPQAPPYGSPYGINSSSSSQYASGLPAPSQYGGRNAASSNYSSTLPPVSHYAQPFVQQPSYGGDYPASPSRPFPCDDCALSFDRHHDLKRHKVTHAGERPYVCNGGCTKTFTRKDALKRHQLSKECGRAEP
ncbi:hypothetical protein DFH09DRAFT_1143206 [Mycena vulgaris]|nr:hypothetical protein DFH09DRAFT_1216812 [Mycena vulgaris]KAJ6586379.1 hypothetical protein DFH09DRAFT_1143206 [Mycena vulgaris]